MRDTTVVNLFGGPGTGKSTKAMILAGELKTQGISTEFVHEFAKDLTWEQRHMALAFQPYIAGKQQYHVHRLLGQVDIVVTDSPYLLSAIYKGDGYTNFLGNHLISCFKQLDTVNIFLKRDSSLHPYNEEGRGQTEEEAIKIDNKILSFLRRNSVAYHIVKMSKDDSTVGTIISLIDQHRGSLHLAKGT